MATALSVSGLEKSFGATKAVDGLSLTVEPGEVVGLIGPDGAGKTTTMRAIVGLVVPDAGRIDALGFDIPRQARQLRAELGYMPQQYSLYGDLSVQENVRFFGGMYGVPRARLREREERLLGIARLLEFRDRPAQALSGGMYKKLALSCALLHSPRLVLLDEPTNGVDPISRRELWQFLGELVGEGVGALVSTPYMDEAERCDRVGLLVGGRLVALGTPAALRAGFKQAIFEVAAAPAPRPEHVQDFAYAREAYTVGRRLHVVSDDGGAELGAALRAHLEGRGLVVGSCAVVPPSFEDVFMGLSGGRA